MSALIAQSSPMTPHWMAVRTSRTPASTRKSFGYMTQPQKPAAYPTVQRTPRQKGRR